MLRFCNMSMRFSNFLMRPMKILLFKTPGPKTTILNVFNSKTDSAKDLELAAFNYLNDA